MDIIGFVCENKKVIGTIAKGLGAIVAIVGAFGLVMVANESGIPISIDIGNEQNIKKEPEINREDESKAAVAAILSITEKAKHYSFSGNIVDAAYDIYDIAGENDTHGQVKIQAIKSLGELAEKCKFESDSARIIELIKWLVAG